MSGSANAVLTNAPNRRSRVGDAASSSTGEDRGPRLRMRVLQVVSSSNQLYSGIGRNLFDLASRLKDRITFEFAIDDHNEKNVSILRQFCDRHDFPLHVGKGRVTPYSLDVFNEDLADLLAQDRWDVIDCLCWANTSTNDIVLKNLGETFLCYTPHNQPISSVPMSPVQATCTSRIHQRVLQRADLVCCVSPQECHELEIQSGSRGTCIYLPNGATFSDFRPGPVQRKPQLLFVGDIAEPRKRIDRILAVFSRLRRRRKDLRLVVIGNKSEQVRDRIPADLRPACELRGYVTEAELRKAYAESAGLLLLSDFEAFGIPVLEALASGTPVFLSRLGEMLSLFRSYRGAHFCAPDDFDGTARMIEETLDRGPEAIREAIADYEVLRESFDWNVIAERKWNAMAAGWYCKQRVQISL